MAFGDFATLRDDFNRANAEDLGANWTMGITAFTGDRSHNIASNRAYAEDDGVFKQDHYTAATFGPSLETYISVPVLPGTNVGDTVTLYTRLTTVGAGTTDGYLCKVMAAASNFDWVIYRLDNGTQTLLNSATGITFQVDDKVGFELIGSNFRGLRWRAGSWTQIVTASDSTYTAAGYIGLQSNHLAQMDDFFAGTIPGAGFSRPPRAVTDVRLRR